MRLRAFLSVRGCRSAVAAPAHAQGALEDAAQALRDSPVYVDPDAERALSERQQVARLRELIADSGAGPDVRRGAARLRRATRPGGDPSAALREIAARRSREPGTYAGVIGDSFRAGALGDGRAGERARARVTRGDGGGRDVRRARGTSCAAWATRAPAAGRAAAAEAAAAASRSSCSCCSALPLALFALSRRRQRKRQEEHARAELEEVKQVAREDLVALGDDIRALDLDVQMPDADSEGKQHYNQAVERYTEAEQALDRASGRRTSSR